MCEKFEPGVSNTWVRNPYYYAVDTEGNQLPYIDYIDDTEIADVEVRKLTVMQGGIDYAAHIHFGASLQDVATLKDAEEEGGYEVRLFDSGSGTGRMFFWNNDPPDEDLRNLYRTPQFKRAMSHAVDREKIQKIVYYNTGIPTTGTMSPKAIEFNFNEEAQAFFEEMRTAYVEYDLDLARSLLDEINVVDSDGDGWREFPDGSPLEVRIDINGEALGEDLTILEIASEGWKEIGLNIVVNNMPEAEFGTMWAAGQGSMRTQWEVGDGPNHLVYPSWVVPNETARWSPLSGRRLQLVGTEKEDTELDTSPWDRQPPRFASSERDLIGEPVWQLQQIYKEAIVEVDEMKRHAMVWDMVRIHKDDGPFYIGTVANKPQIYIVGKTLMNVPTKEELRLGGFVNPWILPSPALTNTETYSFK
jgi:peptide/nickel transport system substrate-binding protein